jgi:hypothetical protein
MVKLVIQMNQQPQGVGFFGNNGNNNDAIMMIEGNDNASITRWRESDTSFQFK